ncbi:MAG: hypothetical protein ACK5Z2_13505 [Bacteroidota bacterium]|jgi:hypothetical protein
MKVELIPVIEITNYGQDVKTPENGPYWEYTDEWENFRYQSSLKAGFSEGLKPYSKATSFYRISELTDADILKSIEKEIVRQQTEEKKGVDDLVCAYSGGYVLRIDEEDIYFPQCCCGLDDLADWEGLLNEDAADFSIGHPYPHVIQKQGKICFDFANAPLREGFVPPVVYSSIEVEKTALEHAIREAKKELDVFAERLKDINRNENLGITEIDKRLILGYDD